MTRSQVLRLSLWAAILALIVVGLIIDHRSNGPNGAPPPKWGAACATEISPQTACALFPAVAGLL